MHPMPSRRSTILKSTRGVTLTVTDDPHKDCWRVSYSSTSFCVLRGSTVEISCSYGYPSDHNIDKTLWYKTGEKPLDLRLETGYEGRVEYLSPEEHKNTLRIRDVRETDSGKYQFRYTTDKPGGAFFGKSVSILVTDLQVSLSSDTSNEGSSVTLTCSTSCNLRGNPIFIWYKNTQPTRHSATINTLHLNPVSREDAGNYSCAVRGHEEHRSPGADLDVRYAPQNTTVNVKPSSGNILEGDSVTLTCSSDANPPVHNYTWYRQAGDDIVLIETGHQNFTIDNVNSETIGLYYCVAHNIVGEDISDMVSLSIEGLVQGFHKEAAIGILIVGITLLVLVLFWLSRGKITQLKKGSATNLPQQVDTSPVYDNVAAIAVTSDPSGRQAAEADDDDVQYASFQFKKSIRTQVDSYINTQHLHPQTTQHDDVQYSSVNYRPKDSSQDEEDPVIYSVVNKPPRRRI